MSAQQPQIAEGDPIACSLDHLGARDRRLEWQHLIRSSLSSRSETPTGVRLAFVASPELDRQLAKLVELERECCAFARWTITREDGETVLRADSDGEGAHAIQQIFRG